MPVPTHMKFVFRGQFTGTPEEWSFSCKTQRDQPAAPDATVNDINEGTVNDAIAALIATNMFPAEVACTGWRAYAIGTNNRMEGNPLVTEYTTPVAGQAGSGYRYPTDTSVCVSLVASDRGPARFGRFYLPQVSLTLGTDARLPQLAAEQIRDAAVNFLKSITDSVDLENIASAVLLNISEIGTGHKQVVDHVKVGRVLDRIERRRRSMVEDYVESGQIDW